MKMIPYTKPIKAGKEVVMMVKHGDQFKLLKVVTNYIRGRNVDSWRVRGKASAFDNAQACVDKLNKVVNAARKAEGKAPVNFTLEDEAGEPEQ